MTATIYRTERGEYAVKWQRATMAAPAYWYFGTLAEALQAARGLFPVKADATVACGHVGCMQGQEATMRYALCDKRGFASTARRDGGR